VYCRGLNQLPTQHEDSQDRHLLLGSDEFVS